MLTDERKNYIIARLLRDGRIVAKETAIALGVSEDTVRRDLRELARNGSLLRVHGGALPVSSATADFAARKAVAIEEKRRLARCGASMISPGQIVFLDGGTTNVELARQLPETLQATVVTHSPSIAVELAPHPRIDVELIGGSLLKHSVVSVGARAAEAISRIRPDLFFLGVTGLRAETGATTGKFEDAAIKSLVASLSGETIVLATTEKIGATSPYVIVSLEDIATIVASADAPKEFIEAIGKCGPDVIFAP